MWFCFWDNLCAYDCYLVGFRCGKTFGVAILRVVVQADDKTSGDASLGELDAWLNSCALESKLYKISLQAVDHVRVIEDCQLGSLGLAKMMWERTGYMGECMKGFWCGAGVWESLGKKGEQWEFLAGHFGIR
nr:hypothetical protein [Tanacetum cinerariifolium]